MPGSILSKSSGAKPIPFSSLAKGVVGLSSLLGSTNPGNASAPTGEIISKPYHNYNSIGPLAPIVGQDENLSLSLDSKSIKIFHNQDGSAKAQNLICFIERSPAASRTRVEKQKSG